MTEKNFVFLPEFAPHEYSAQLPVADVSYAGSVLQSNPFHNPQSLLTAFSPW